LICLITNQSIIYCITDDRQGFGSSFFSRNRKNTPNNRQRSRALDPFGSFGDPFNSMGFGFSSGYGPDPFSSEGYGMIIAYLTK